ncbi:hypothetical protein VTN77DRAFT_4444 [Rasamsonia byssochlamydoides]|uniref:uncharacterized protein n=1 Tax=Rasamsonia byssochlamydoides TaxID=89139 RepID=UPI003743A125
MEAAMAGAKNRWNQATVAVTTVFMVDRRSVHQTQMQQMHKCKPGPASQKASVPGTKSWLLRGQQETTATAPERRREKRRLGCANRAV